jgi:hypothetical protein
VNSGVFVDFSRGVSVGRPMCQLGLALGDVSRKVCKRSRPEKVLAVILSNTSPNVIYKMLWLVMKLALTSVRFIDFVFLLLKSGVKLFTFWFHDLFCVK